jgi:hypothetical protein
VLASRGEDRGDRTPHSILLKGSKLGGKSIFPTVELCQSLSDLYQDICLFRFDALTGDIYILAGENLEIIIYQDGNWEFI